jgi:hypothetical protein
VDDDVHKALALAQELRQQPWQRHALRAAMLDSGLCQIEQHAREVEAIYLNAVTAASN